jgi:hypothetical protein
LRQKNVPVRLIRSTSSHSCAGIPVSCRPLDGTPALLTARSSRPKLGDGPADRRPDGVLVGDVDPDGDRTPAYPGDLLGGLVRCGLVQVEDRHRRAAAGETGRDGASDPAAGPGDQADLAGEVAHASVS